VHPPGRHDDHGKSLLPELEAGPVPALVVQGSDTPVRHAARGARTHRRAGLGDDALPDTKAVATVGERLAQRLVAL
jgi:hypothetical protein